MTTSRHWHHARFIIVAFVLFAAAGCTQTFDAATLGVDASMSEPVSAQVQGETFKVSKKAVYLLAGIIPASRPSLGDILASQVTGDARIANLRIEVRSKPTDILISILTLGLIVPRSVTYEGVVLGQ